MQCSIVTSPGAATSERLVTANIMRVTTLPRARYTLYTTSSRHARISDCLLLGRQSDIVHSTPTKLNSTPVLNSGASIRGGGDGGDRPPPPRKRASKIFFECNTCIHTHPFNGPLSGTTRVSQYQKGETNLDFTEAGDSEWQ